MNKLSSRAQSYLNFCASRNLSNPSFMFNSHFHIYSLIPQEVEAHAPSFNSQDLPTNRKLSPSTPGARIPTPAFRPGIRQGQADLPTCPGIPCTWRTPLHRNILQP